MSNKDIQKFLTMDCTLETKLLILDYLTTDDVGWEEKHKKEIRKAKIDIENYGQKIEKSKRDFKKFRDNLKPKTKMVD